MFMAMFVVFNRLLLPLLLLLLPRALKVFLTRGLGLFLYMILMGLGVCGWSLRGFARVPRDWSQ